MKKVLKYFLYVYFSPKGRIHRTGWCLGTGVFYLFAVVMTILGFDPFSTIELGTQHILFKFIDALTLLLMYSLIVISIKRFRDTNRSGWSLLWVFFPIFEIFYILIICIFFKGMEGENKYGAPSSLIDWDSFDNDPNDENQNNFQFPC